MDETVLDLAGTQCCSELAARVGEQGIIAPQPRFRVDISGVVCHLYHSSLEQHLGGEMSTVASHFTKFQVGAAATTVAAAMVLTPAAIAHARPDLVPTMPTTTMISTDLFGTDPILGPVSFSLPNPLCWVDNSCSSQGAAVPSTGTTIFQFTPLSLLPGFARPLGGWFTQFIPQFSICVAGLSVSLGAYATLTIKTGAC
ncbi:hypothetical protein [Mycolicibacterium sp.]|uniref:hypothetical protein n=1 Tax=Mycolicibacterium sp. TaxID=2320850 RepID=UPI001A32D253|nr:hypothetical protein [Mycolicibacterium sp.]MBJ7336728.1 hypothetical protein [Mycolicibacterium sp.]